MPSEFAPARPQLKLWRPRRVLLHPAARILAPAGRLPRKLLVGAEVVELSSNRLNGLVSDDPRQADRNANSTLAVVISPASKRKLQPIPPNADWRFDLAEGCPAHCQYCYLAGSLSGPPITRVYANIEEILDGLSEYVGCGPITSASQARADEGTTYEASCSTDPMEIEHLTGSLANTIRHFGAWGASVQLRFTTKYDNVDSLLTLKHAIARACASRPTAFRSRASKQAPPACRRASPPCGARRSQVIRLGLPLRRSCRKVIGTKLIGCSCGKLRRRLQVAKRRFESGTYHPPLHAQIEEHFEPVVQCLLAPYGRGHQSQETHRVRLGEIRLPG